MFERHSIHEVLKNACQEEKLSPESKVCKHIEKKQEHEEHHSY
jgi:hypothetical protein